MLVIVLCIDLVVPSVFSHASGSGEGSGSGDGGFPSPPDFSSSPASSHNSLHSHPAKQSGHNYTAPSSPAGFHPSRRASHAKIHFAPLPAVPPEFRRRNSISLGVASRRNLIGMQGQGHKGGVQRVVMSDEDWDNYCKQFEEKQGNNDVIDVGQLAKSGAKALWRSVKRRRSGSQSSQNSTASTATTASTSASPSTVSDSAPLGRHSLTGTSNSGSTHSLNGPLNGSLHLAPVREESEFALKSIPGSPPATTIDDAGLPPMRVRAPVPRRPHSPRHVHAAHAMLHNSAMETDMGMGDGDAAMDGDGDATPRRRPSPPPRLADKLPTEDELEQIADEDEEEEAQDAAAAAEVEEGEEEMAGAPLSPVAEGASRPEVEPEAEAVAGAGAEAAAPPSPEEQASIESHDTESRETHEDRKRGRRSAVLGFDVERFGFMSIHDKNH